MRSKRGIEFIIPSPKSQTPRLFVTSIEPRQDIQRQIGHLPRPQSLDCNRPHHGIVSAQREWRHMQFVAVLRGRRLQPLRNGLFAATPPPTHSVR